jgi:hypothetical protein
MMLRGATAFTCELDSKSDEYDVNVELPSSDACGSSVLMLDVYAHRKVGGDDYIGGIKEGVDLLHEPGTKKGGLMYSQELSYI